jgi:L-iditol 2-dehydrogenase
MKALLLREYSQLEMTDLPAPIPAADELLVRVEACGICGSDVHGYDGTSGRRIPPLVMGHEAAGTVVSRGAACNQFAVGDRITFDSTVYCGQCVFCTRGQVNLCETRQVLGVSCGDYRRMGAFAELVAIPERIAYRLPDALSFAEAAMLEAASVAMHAVRLTPPEPGDTAVVLGAGMIGALTAQAARGYGYAQVIVADLDIDRLKRMREMGFEHTLQATGEELLRQVQARTGGLGADAVFEAVGKNETVNVAIDCVRKGGRVTLIGNVTPAVTISLQKVVSRELRLQGSAASSGEYPEAMQWMRDGKICVKQLISAVAPLEEGAEWFRRLYGREPGLMKVILAPNGTEAAQ